MVALGDRMVNRQNQEQYMKRTMKLNIAMLLVAGLMMSSLNAGYFNDWVTQPLTNAASWVTKKATATRDAVTPEFFENKYVKPVVIGAKVALTAGAGYKAVTALLRGNKKQFAAYLLATAAAAYAWFKPVSAQDKYEAVMEGSLKPAANNAGELVTVNNEQVRAGDVYNALING